MPGHPSADLFQFDITTRDEKGGRPRGRIGPSCGIGPQPASGTQAPIDSASIARRTPDLSPGRRSSNADLVLGLRVVQYRHRVAVGDTDDAAFDKGPPVRCPRRAPELPQPLCSFKSSPTSVLWSSA